MSEKRKLALHRLPVHSWKESQHTNQARSQLHRIATLYCHQKKEKQKNQNKFENKKQ